MTSYAELTDRLKHREIAYQIITDLLGFQPRQNKAFTFSDDSKAGNDYLHSDGEFWFIKNFATGKTYSAIDAFMLRNRCDFPTAIQQLSARYLGHLQPINEAPNNRNHFKQVIPTVPLNVPPLHPVKEFTVKELEYWRQYGITDSVLQEFGVSAIKGEESAFAYRFTDTCYKIYRPMSLDHKKRFQWIGKKSAGNLWGLEQIPESIEVLLICEGLKDALTINSHTHCFHRPVWAIASDNASGDLDPLIIAELKAKYEIILCFDADEAGQQASFKHSKVHGLRSIQIKEAITDLLGLEISKELKDVADLFKRAYSELQEGELITDLKDFFSGLITNAIAPPVTDGEPLRNEATDQSDGWQAPQPIVTTLLPVEPMLPEMIPEPLRPWLSDIAYRMRCPLDYVASTAIVMIGAIVGTRCGIRPKFRDDWVIVPNLWGGPVGNPSQLKTPSINEVLKPLRRLEAEARETYETDLKQYNATYAVYKAQGEALKSCMMQAAKGKGGTDLDELKIQLIQLEEPVEPTERRYQTSDSTVEKLGELLNENPTGLLVFRDELIGLLASWDKQGRETDRAFYLEAWNGTNSHTSDRIGRGTVYVANCCLSLLGGIQPSKLIGYLHAAQGHENDGLVQRLQVLVYPDAPEWKLIDQYPNNDAKNRAFTLIKRLSEMQFVDYGATQGEGDQFPYMRFDPQAQELFYQWITDLETNKIRAGDCHPLLLEHFAKYRSLMPSLALIFHLVDAADGLTNAKAVSLSATQKAVDWCRYLETHARRIYALAGNETASAAAELAKRIKQGKLQDGFTARKVYNNDWHLLNNRESAQKAIDWLVDAHWLSEVPAPPTNGRPAASSYKMNPKILNKPV